MKLGILFGSSSNEHEVSIVSASSIIKNLNKAKYEVTPIYMDKENHFFEWKQDIENIVPLEIGILPTKLKKIKKPFNYLKKFDCVFLMVHGKNGEDGVLSTILDFLKIKYVGNNASSSMISMDKVYTKDELELNEIQTSKYMSFYRYNNEYIMKSESYQLEELLKMVETNLNYPMFVKPASSGSSIGVSKANNIQDLEKAVLQALEINAHILIEEEVLGRELECGILEKNGEIIASCVGEVYAADEFYSFDAKYKNDDSKTIIPADISIEIEHKIQEIAKKAFKTLNLHIYSRCDFFLTKDNEIILNEINTIPGFTEISMYPKLFEARGFKYSEVLDMLIEEAIK